MSNTKQETLLVETPPQLETLDPVPLEKINRGAWGPEPDTQFSRAIATLGVLTPVILESASDGTWNVIDGRKRILAAEKAGHTTIPALSLIDGRPGLVEPVVTLATNGGSRGNPIIELRAIEDTELAAKQAGKTCDDITIARVTGMPLKLIRKRRRLANLHHELRTGWETGLISDRVGEQASKLDQHKQDELARRLNANGTITAADITEVKKTSVRRHQRTLPDERRHDRILEHVTKALRDAQDEYGDDHDIVAAIREVLELLDSTDGDEPAAAEKESVPA